MTGLVSIIRRELAVGARQKATYRSRLYAGGVVLAFFALFIMVQNQPPNVLGRMLFGISSTLLFLQALLSGLRLTADCLSEEKREGTLGLLFLTEMSSAEVVLGKMGVRSLRGFYALMATLPIFTFCILLGGVRGTDAFYIAVALIATMIFSLAVGVFVSAHSREDKAAFMATFGVLAALTLLPVALASAASYVMRIPTAVDYLMYLSPLHLYNAVPASSLRVGEFWKCVFLLNAAACALLVGSVYVLNRSFRSEFADNKRPAHTTKGGQFRGMSGKPARVPLTNPFLWLLNRRELTARLMWGFSILTVVLGMIGGLLLRRTGVGAFVAMTFFTLYGLHVTWKLFVVSDALRRLHLDHRSGALELLLSTPLEPEEIIASQLKRIQRVFLPGAAALAVANALVFSDRNLNDLPVLPIGGALILLLDGRAMTWMAMLEAFRPGRYLAGIFRVAGIIMVPPMVTMILTITAKRGFTSEEANAIFFFYFIGCAIYDLALLKRAKSRLIKQFRMLAAEGQPREAAVGSTLPKPLQWLLLAEPSPSAARAQ